MKNSAISIHLLVMKVKNKIWELTAFKYYKATLNSCGKNFQVASINEFEKNNY